MRNLNTIFITCSFLIIAFSANAQVCNCSIDQVENNSVNPCTIVTGEVVTVNSVSSFRNAINQANASGGNMTILIEDGTYQVSSSVSYPYITANNLVIRSLSGNRDMVILHGGGMHDVSPNTEDGLNVAGNNVIIADLTIKDVGNHGIQVSGHNLRVHNVRIQNTYQQMLKGATSASSIDSAVIQCSLFEYTSGVGPNYYIGGLDIHKGKDWIVRDNVFKNIISPAASTAEHAIHFWNNSANNTIERNLIINCDRGIGFGLGSSPNTGGLVRNNMIYNDGSGLFNDVGIALESSPGTKVYNNTIYIQYENAIEYRFSATTAVDMINNLTNKLIRSRDGGQGNVSNNVTDAEASWFEDVSEGDLHLAFDVSGVVNQGVDLSTEVTDDFDQTSRPQGSAFDIGAHELIMTGINIKSDYSTIRLFPNPNEGIFNIFFVNLTDSPGEYVIEIYNVIGEKVLSKKCQEQNCIFEIDPSERKTGIYFVKLYVKEKVYVEKFLLQ
ncbi:MAG TPA: T9SS type A sorting domain-containing protein [Saprospiraceae bacterium]|nr:T9SS type A sorting domain-containing protein [Saprospiraceae bacterium]